MRTISLILLSAVLIPATAQAQSHPQTRNGFTISFGIGSGSASFDCDGCNSDQETAGSGYLRIGGAVRPNLIIAGQINSWTKSRNDAALSISTLAAVAQWYPNVTGGFYVEGGIGAGTITTQYIFGGGTFSTSKSGLGFQAGAGYDWRVARNFSLTPYVNYFSASTGSASYGSNSDKLNAKVFHFGLGFTWH